MGEVKKCPKCCGKMVEGSEQNLNDSFRCTRPPSDSNMSNTTIRFNIITVKSTVT